MLVICLVYVWHNMHSIAVYLSCSFHEMVPIARDSKWCEIISLPDAIVMSLRNQYLKAYAELNGSYCAKN